MLAVTERAKLYLQSGSTAMLLWMVVSCATVSAPNDEAPFTPATVPETQGQVVTVYQLQPGDVLDIKFYYASDLNEHVKIRPDGKISLQLIGELDVASLTPQDLDSLLRERYARILVNPEVAVIVREFAGQKAYVGGEVNSPGVIAFDAPHPPASPGMGGMAEEVGGATERGSYSQHGAASSDRFLGRHSEVAGSATGSAPGVATTIRRGLCAKDGYCEGR